MTKEQVLANLDNWINIESEYVYTFNNDSVFKAVSSVEVYNHVKELILYYLNNRYD